MVVSRRSFVSSCLILASMSDTPAVSRPGAIHLRYARGRLSWPGGAAPAACGRAGVRPDKREGDGASPAGRFPLLDAYYRADRIARPASGLATRALRLDDGWVDNPADPQYNRLVSLPYPAHH